MNAHPNAFRLSTVDASRKQIHEFTFSGQVRCGHCGCYLDGEFEKNRYVDYLCTGNKTNAMSRRGAKHPSDGTSLSILETLAIPESVLKWLDHELTHSNEQEERIPGEHFDRKMKETRSKQKALRAKVSQHQTDTTDLRAGFNMMCLTSIACREFERHNAREQRKLFGLVPCFETNG